MLCTISLVSVGLLGGCVRIATPPATSNSGSAPSSPVIEKAHVEVLMGKSNFEKAASELVPGKTIKLKGELSWPGSAGKRVIVGRAALYTHRGITQVLGEQQVSIKSVVQRGMGEHARLVMVTHPVLELLATTKFFGSGHPLSGLDPTALGAIYRGRAQFRPSVEARKAGASREAERRQTIAERKAAEAQPSDTRGRGKDA